MATDLLEGLSFSVPGDGMLSESQAREIVDLAERWHLDAMAVLEALSAELGLSEQQSSAMTQCVALYVALQALVAAGIVVKAGPFYTRARAGEVPN